LARHTAAIPPSALRSTSSYLPLIMVLVPDEGETDRVDRACMVSPFGTGPSPRTRCKLWAVHRVVQRATEAPVAGVQHASGTQRISDRGC
jgi:hypothetical protein